MRSVDAVRTIGHAPPPGFDRWIDYVERVARRAGVEVECRIAFYSYLANGSNEDAAARTALWDWDAT